jgi:hypothetical protein
MPYVSFKALAEIGIRKLLECSLSIPDVSSQLLLLMQKTLVKASSTSAGLSDSKIVGSCTVRQVQS